MEQNDSDQATQVQDKEELCEPPMYRVLMHNDDFTTMDFVVHVLISIFQKNDQEANTIMMDIHLKGLGVVGLFTFDIASSRVNRVHSEARAAGFPLKCSIEAV